MEVITATQALSKSLIAALKDFYPAAIDNKGRLCFENELYGLLKLIEFAAEGVGRIEDDIMYVEDASFNLTTSFGVQLGFLANDGVGAYDLLTCRLNAADCLKELEMCGDVEAVDRLEEELFALIDSMGAEGKGMRFIQAALDDGSLPADILAEAEGLLAPATKPPRKSAYRDKTRRNFVPKQPKRRGFGRTLRRKRGQALVANK
jgi:hypothetical protein